MKDNLENSFKESLENFEMPYNSAAWTAMSSKLDAKLPTTPKSNFKWYAIASSAILLISVGTYFYMSQNDDTTKSKNATQSTKVEDNSMNVNPNENKINSIESHSSDNNNSETIELNETNGGNHNTTNSNTNTSNSVIETPNNGGNDNTNPLSNNTGSQENGNSTNPNDNNVNTNTEITQTSITFKTPAVTDICPNETINLKNDNKVKLWILSPDNIDFHIKPLANGTFTPTSSGLHKLGYFDKEGFVEKTSFVVAEGLHIDFEIDENQRFENSVPVTKVSTNVPGTNFIWKFDNQTAKGREAEGHFFTRGNHTISLTVEGANGCQSTKTETIFINFENGDKGNYNLMAVNTITPNSAIQENQSFMPAGLLTRDKEFTLTIYSMDDAHKVFSTNDVSNGWRGVDVSNGRMVENGSTFYWEVILENPMQGESPKYKGTITVLN